MLRCSRNLIMVSHGHPTWSWSPWPSYMVMVSMVILHGHGLYGHSTWSWSPWSSYMVMVSMVIQHGRDLCGHFTWSRTCQYCLDCSKNWKHLMHNCSIYVVLERYNTLFKIIFHNLVLHKKPKYLYIVHRRCQKWEHNMDRQHNSYSICHLLGTVTTLWLDSDSVVTFVNCRQHGDYTVWSTV